MALNKGIESGKVRFTGEFLRKKGFKYSTQNGEKINPNKSYIRNPKHVMDILKANQPPKYSGKFLKENGINYNPYSETREAIKPNKLYAIDRKAMDQQIKNNATPTKIKYRGKFLKKNGINYDVDNGTKINPNHNYQMTRSITESAIRRNQYVKDHPYSSAHPNLGWKGDLKRKARRLGAKMNEGAKYHRHAMYSGSYLRQNGIYFNPYKKITMKSKPLDPNKSYSFPKDETDGYIKAYRSMKQKAQFKQDHPYSSAHPNRGFVGDAIHKGSLDAHNIKNVLHSKLEHAFSGGVSHSVSVKRPTTARGLSKGKARALVGRDASARQGITAGMHKGGLRKSPKKTIARKARANKQTFHL